ncbi:hypothetical protein HanRHA438_Chr04g0154541 [Helianthus annuus]|nr:hypothetical protein HanRHA438_Chr04g0154541 [Helianthus annuus]
MKTSLVTFAWKQMTFVYHGIRSHGIISFVDPLEFRVRVCTVTKYMIFMPSVMLELV